MNFTILAFVGLCALSVILVAYAILYKSISNDKKSNDRIKNLQADKQTKIDRGKRQVDEKQRRKARENTLKNVEEQQKAGKKRASLNLRSRIEQAGMTVSLPKFYIYSAIFGVVAFLVASIFVGGPIFVPLGIGLAAGFGVPVWFVNFKRNRRFKAFTKIFPNAIDIIVRGIRSGLPLNDCLRVIAADSEEPVRSEFKKLIEATQMGITIPDACQRLYESVPTSETSFFSIVISIQSSAGGNLSEALSNLSRVLRERRRMADKITAFSTEAKTSAIIIGSLPFIVSLLIAFSSPGYLDPLFTTPTGNKVLFCCAGLMAFGIGIMKKMINFKF